MKHLLCLALLAWTCTSAVPAAGEKPWSLSSELAGLVTAADADPATAEFSLRFVPELFAEAYLSDHRSLGLFCTADHTASVRLTSGEANESDVDVDIYRAWLRYGASQFEARLGLQKISFGAAQLLRPLMWFDSVDPRDPLQITKGVYGLLLRYYFLNNVNLWAWGLLENDDPKGWEFLPTEDDPEYGGRLQVPVPRGEAALTYHHRTAGLTVAAPGFPAVAYAIPEDRFAFDAKLDLRSNFWFEGVLTHQDSRQLPLPYRHLLTFGVDCPFGLGGGLYMVAEHVIAGSSDEAFGPGRQSHITAVSGRYRWGVIDQLSAIYYYDWDSEQSFRFAQWRRAYDRWEFNLIGFWNPPAAGSLPLPQGRGALLGPGAQLVVVFNH